MGLNDTPGAERVCIGIFGRTNVGKSSVFNTLVNQDAAVVSATKGTTTDAVVKTMELLPIGPVEFIDTAGFDDEGELGQKRIERTQAVLQRTDIALLVIDAIEAKSDTYVFSYEKSWIAEFKRRSIPYLIILNKADELNPSSQSALVARSVKETGDGDLQASPVILYSTRDEGDFSADALRQTITSIYKEDVRTHRLVSDLVVPKSTVILVVPIDESAPKGRLILPQQQVIRELLEAGAYALVCRDSEVEDALMSMQMPPKLVVTDSQVFETVAKAVPKTIPLTSFSILQARYKGNLRLQVEGARAIEELREGARILIAEGCTHHRQCKDIGSVKIPGWLEFHTGKVFHYEFTSGREFPKDLVKYDMVIHCGGCMLRPREMRNRIAEARDAGVPVTNYGVLIAYLHGILDRVLSPFD